jgi:nicotinamide-nucleotide amidase
MMKDLTRLMLEEPRLTLSAAESVTCGHVQTRVGAISGASNFFLGGVTAYTLDQKVRHLGVDRAAARRVNSVSSAIAEQMARGVCALFRSDLGVATTGYAEPSTENSVIDPFAWWALAHRQRAKFVILRSGRVECPGANRIEAQLIVADAVLAELLAYLREMRG